MLEEMRRMVMVTSGVAELTRNKAEQIVRDLVKAGDVRRDHTSQLVKELLTRSAENRRELTGFVRSEIRAQIENLGVAGKRDFEKLERRISRLEDAAREDAPSGGAGAPGKPTSRKRSAAKKTTTKKTTPRKTTAKKPTKNPSSEGGRSSGSARS